MRKRDDSRYSEDDELPCVIRVKVKRT